MQSYSHNAEDVLLAQLFAAIDNGYYVDVGANIPIESSNTYALYLKGWHGLVIDPLLQYLRAKWQAARPRDQRIEVALGRKPGWLDFWICNKTQFSTGSLENIAYWHSGEGTEIGVPNAKVPLLTLNQLLRANKVATIHLLNVDVEGMEDDVLLGLDLNIYRPWIMCIEATLPGKTGTFEQLWHARVLEAGYQWFHDDEINRFYVADEHRHLLGANHHGSHPA